MAELLINQFFQRSFFDALGKHLSENYPSWDQDKFIGLIYDKDWDEKALMERMAHASQALQQCLPPNYVQAIDILRKVCHHFSGFDGILFSNFVQQFGQDDLSTSLLALETFTQIGSAEFAIRPFISNHPDEVMAQMVKWSGHPNVHVRRLSSEGCRPRLPWAMALPQFKKNPSPVLPILENLKDDPEIYVRKSVANHLNDIAKDNPETILNLLEQWKTNASTEREWIIKHALRSLIKQGNPRALAILGFEAKGFAFSALKLSSTEVQLGENLHFDFRIKNKSETRGKAVVDYIIHFMKANGTLQPKVFKLKNIDLGAGESINLIKSHPLQKITTRQYYSGIHRLDIQINGVVVGGKDFSLTC
ncbi:MAG: DNA alkylation repair protein [Cyclobacteriaceae bacterium]|nr:DNA alkylation repair protein [Cyclobacteriaceae bacterium HetDA_MAG_MS6]